MHRNVRFNHAHHDANPSEALDEHLPRASQQKLSSTFPHLGRGSNDSDSEVEEILPERGATMTSLDSLSSVPTLFTSVNPIRDLLQTESSNVLDFTVQDCLPFLAGTDESCAFLGQRNAHGLPRLQRKEHIAHLHKSLGHLPSALVVADASRPWMLYWALSGLCLLGQDVSPYRERCVLISHSRTDLEQCPPRLHLGRFHRDMRR